MKSSRISTARILFILLAVTPATWADEKTDQIDVVFDKFTKPGSPGCSMAVARAGEILYSRGYGLAQLEYDIPITPKTIFHVASVSKQFTAFAIILLAQEGKLSLDDDIRKYLSEVHDFGKALTIRHLIHHTSGIRDQWEILGLMGWRWDDVFTTADILDAVSRQRELNFNPGEEELYSNMGYTLLGVIVERVSGKPLREFCAERIFKPLGMERTHYHDDHRLIVKDRAYSYAPKDDGFENSVLSYATAGATSLFTTAEDLVKWMDNFRTMTVGGSEVIESMLTRGRLNNDNEIGYASALSHGSHRGLRIIGHGGADAGFRSEVVWFPDQQLQIAVLGNISSVSAAGLARKVADVYLSDLYTVEEKPKPEEGHDAVALSEDALKALAGPYVDPLTGVMRQFNFGDGRLRIIRPGSGALGLEALSETKFQTINRGIPMTVAFESSGESIAVTIEETGFETKNLVKAGVKPEGANGFEVYTGTYYSPELDVFFRVSLNDGKLTVKRPKHGTFELMPNYADGFVAMSLRYHFTRNADGAVDGFRLFGGRVYKLRLEKVEWPLMGGE